MKITVARTPLERDQLDHFFETFTLWRDVKTKERVVMWRPARFLILFFGLLSYLYVGSVLAVTWWLQAAAPGSRIGYHDVANPLRWSRIVMKWMRYQNAHAPPAGPFFPDDEDTDAAGGAAAPPAEAGTKDNARSAPVYSVADSPLAGSMPYGPLLAQYFTRNGGTQKLDAIHSVQVVGTVTMPNGTSVKFTMVKKPPGEVRISMHNNLSGSEATVLTNGADTWQWVGDPYQNGVQRSSADEASALLREEFYCDTPIELIHNLSVLREIPREVGEDEPYNIIETRLARDMRLMVFLNPDTWHADRLQIDYDQNGAPCSYVILASNWMTVDGVAEPAQLQVYANGQPLLQCHIDGITYNLGAYDVLFVPPADAPKKASSTPPPKPVAPVSALTRLARLSPA
jgi:hypothetical protein